MKVFGWWANYDGCAFYRITEPMRALEEFNGWETSGSRILPDVWPEFDAIIGQRICNASDSGGPAREWMDLCKDSHTLTIYEIDDDLLSIDPTNPAFDVFNDPNTQMNIKVCAANADIVTVSTEPLRDVMLKFNPNVRVIPNYVSSDLLNIAVRHESNRPIVGWAGSATHKIDFTKIGDGLKRAMQENPQARLMTIGAGYGTEVPRIQTIRYPWTRSVRRLYPQIARFDIGLAPLSPSKFNESKSYIKALEYAALGIPVVASNYGPYKDFVQHEETGFLVSTPEEWYEAINTLIRDPDLRTRMGSNAFQQAMNYTIDEHYKKWVDAITA